MVLVPLATIDSDVETQDEALPLPPVKGHQFRLVWGTVLLSVVLAAAVIATRHPFQNKADISSIVSKDSEDQICLITIFHACGCSNCDATVKTQSGEERCFSTVAVKDTDDDNDECHEYSTKCNLEVGQKYVVECSGDWDSGAKLQIGNSEVCDGKAETKTFVAEAAPTVSPREQYEKLMQNKKGYKHFVQKYGWSKTLRTCLADELGRFNPEFDDKDEDKVHAVEWDDLDTQLRTKIMSVKTCEEVSRPNGIFTFTTCMDKGVLDAATAEAGDDDDDEW